MKCKNCDHTLLYSDEHEFWFHEREQVKWTKDPEYDVVVDEEDRYCAVKVDKMSISDGTCGCKKPEPKVKK